MSADPSSRGSWHLPLKKYQAEYYEVENALAVVNLPPKATPGGWATAAEAAGL
jgi:hypothetical protein